MRKGRLSTIYEMPYEKLLILRHQSSMKGQWIEELAGAEGGLPFLNHCRNETSCIETAAQALHHPPMFPDVPVERHTAPWSAAVSASRGRYALPFPFEG